MYKELFKSFIFKCDKSKQTEKTTLLHKQKLTFHTVERFILNYVQIEFRDNTRKVEIIEQERITKYSDDKVIQFSFRLNTPEPHYTTLTYFKSDIVRIVERYKVGLLSVLE